MNEGRIAQTGTPRGVYRNPANRFVAEFVGTNNILTGVVSGLGPDRIEIDTGIGRFQAVRPDVPRMSDGQPVTFVVSADLVPFVSRGGGAGKPCRLRPDQRRSSSDPWVTLFLETDEGVELKAQTSQRNARTPRSVRRHAPLRLVVGGARPCPAR